MTKLSKRALALLLGATTLLTLAGCGSSGSSDSAASDSSAAKTETASAETETDAAEASNLSGDLNIWEWGADDEAKAREAATKIFIEEHPELNVTYTIIPTADSVWDQKAAAALSSGSAGDVMQMSRTTMA